MPKPNDRRSREPTKANTPSSNTPSRPLINKEAMAGLIAQIPTMAEALRAATDRAAMTAALAPILEQAEPEQIGFATTLGNQRGDAAPLAADIAEALAELGADRAAAKEARRSLIRLRSAGTRPTITIPRPPLPVDDVAPGQAAPEFIQGWASRTREKSEVALALAWSRPNQPGDIDAFVLELNMWNGVITEAVHIAPMPQRRFEREILTPRRDRENFTWTTVDQAQSLALVEATLDQGTWRKAPQSAEWNEVADLILRRLHMGDVAPDPNAGRMLIDADAEAEETLVNFWGSWSFGDYGLVYDLLSDRHALRERETRDDFIALRRKWYDEAHPARIQIGAVAPQAQEQSGLWLPGGSKASANRQNLAFFWSLELEESPLAGQISEMPLATITNPDSTRHWFWLSVTLEREEDRWRIGRIRDEALAAQSQPVDELMQRSDAAWQEADAKAQQIAQAQEAGQQVPSQESLAVMTLAQETLSRGECALMRLLADRTLHEQLHDRAIQVGLWDRAAAVTHRILAHFPNDQARGYRDLSMLDFRKAQTFAETDDEANFHRWLDIALDAARKAVELDRTAETLTILGELQSTHGDLEEAETNLRAAIEMQPSVGAWADLGDLLMRRQHYQEAIGAFESAQRLDPTSPQVRWRLGRALEAVDRKPEAKLVYEDALANDANDAMAHALLGNILTEEGDHVGALQHLEQAVRQGLISAEILVQMAFNFARLGRFGEAQSLLEQAKQIEPSLTQQIEQLQAQVRREAESVQKRPRR
jgi:tetratricopeptide (TPR) repeat protein